MVSEVVMSFLSLYRDPLIAAANTAYFGFQDRRSGQSRAAGVAVSGGADGKPRPAAAADRG